MTGSASFDEGPGPPSGLVAQKRVDRAEEERLVRLPDAGEREKLLRTEIAEQRLHPLELIGTASFVELLDPIEKIREHVQELPDVEDVLEVPPEEPSTRERGVEITELLEERRGEGLLDLANPETELVHHRVDPPLEELPVHARAVRGPARGLERHEPPHPAGELLPHEAHVARQVAHSLAVPAA